MLVKIYNYSAKGYVLDEVKDWSKTLLEELATSRSVISASPRMDLVQCTEGA